ncbi:uncharacterized protein LOC125238118 [Leguminivora glycinivorella]|uniref:uncharacterized protein LOC125238118 n=1 Tax=Leguminivora glycinivorella TaxID=1035111 RepID=UPI00200CF664|nr:uncharacterized protein LOC125238118 [Leguminivora glycinivorella]
MTSDKKGSWRCVSCRTGNNNLAPPDINTAPAPSERQHVLQKSTSGAPASPVVSDLPSQLDQGFASVLKEIKEFRADFSLLKVDLQFCKESISNINTKLDEFEPRLSDTEDRINIVEGKTSLISKLQTDLNSAKMVITTLQQENEAREQYSRINNVEISGLPFKKGENLISVLDSIYTVVGLKMEAQFIDSVQRVRRFQPVNSGDGGNGDSERPSSIREPAVIVRFTRRLYKDQLLSAVRARKGITTSSIGLNGPALNLYLGDHLTPASKQLLKRARELKRDNKIAYLWIRDCKILARKTETSRVMVIDNHFDFNKIK